MNDSGWVMSFQFRNLADAESFHDYVTDEFGLKDVQIKFNARRRKVTITSEVIDAFTPLARKSIIEYIPLKVELYSVKGE